MPGDPIGMPATARPATFGFSFSKALNVGSRDVALDHVTADECGMAGARLSRHAVLVLHGVDVSDVLRCRRESLAAQMLDPVRTASARRVLEDLNRYRLLRVDSARDQRDAKHKRSQTNRFPHE
jgi:hypothetical protein